MEYPDIEVELLPQPSPDTSRHFALGNADMGIFASYGPTGRITVQDADISEYRTDQLVAVVPRGHDLATRQGVGLRDLVEAGLIGLRPASPFMEHLRKAADSEGFLLRLKYEVTTNESARALVRAGLGVSIQPHGVLGLEDYTRISLVPLTQGWATRRLSIAVQTGQPLSTVARVFVNQLVGCTDTHGHPEKPSAEAACRPHADVR
jgi:DNA-binding transcriptional LysR family regulator